MFTESSVHTTIRLGHLPCRVTNHNREQNETGADESSRQPERKDEEVRDRAHEEGAMNGDPSGRLGDLDEALESQTYPITTDELVASHGDCQIETQGGTTSLEEVLAGTENQTYETADDVRNRVLGLIHR